MMALAARRESTLIVSAVFTLFLAVSGVRSTEVGASCYNSTDVCTSPGLTCSNGICICGDGYVMSADGLSCTGTRHGDYCDPPEASCEKDTICIREKNNGNYRCLCNQNSFRSSNRACDPLSDLKVKSVTATTTTRILTLAWTVEQHGKNVSYTIQPEPSDRTVSSASETGGNVTDLTPGKLYNVRIMSTLPTEAYYPEKQVSVHEIVNMKPAKPEDSVFVKLGQKVYESYQCNVVFSGSEGEVASYTFTVTTHDGKDVETASGLTTTSFTLYNILPSSYYNFTLVAYNAIHDESEPATGTFKTEGRPPGQVKALTEGNKTEDSAMISWKLPSLPNGEILGYQVEVKSAQLQCKDFYVITCSDCSGKPVFLTPDSCTDLDGGEYPSSTLNDKDGVITLELSNLKPKRLYIVFVKAVNSDGIGEEGSATILTPSTPRSLTLTPTRNEALNWVGISIGWVPENPYGNGIYYSIQVDEETSLGSNQFQTIEQRYFGVATTPTTNATVDNVLADWKYKVLVIETSGSYFAAEFGPEYVKSLSNVPGIAQVFTLQQDGVIAQNMTITIGCPTKQDRNGTIEGFTIRKTLVGVGSEQDQTEDFPVKIKSESCGNSVYSAIDVGGIIAERNYKFEVQVRNDNFSGSFSNKQSLYIQPRVPILKKTYSDGSVLLRPTSKSILFDTQISIVVCASCLTDSRQGTVKAVGILVCVLSGENTCSVLEGPTESLDDFSTHTSWAQAKASNFSIPYRTTPNKWHEQIPDTSKASTYIVGSDTNCDISSPQLYCNGPIPAGSNVIMTVIACNDAGCDEVNVNQIFQTKAESTPPPDEEISAELITGLSVGCVAVIGIILLVAILLIKRRCTNPGNQQTDYNDLGSSSNPDHQYIGRLKELNINSLRQDEETDVQYVDPSDYDYAIDNDYDIYVEPIDVQDPEVKSTETLEEEVEKDLTDVNQS